MRRSSGSRGFERKVRFPSKTLAMYEPSGLVIASSKPKKTKSWQRLVQVKSGTRCRIAAEDTPRASMADLRSRGVRKESGVCKRRAYRDAHSRPAERLQAPRVFVPAVAEDVQVPVARMNFEEGVGRAAPLVHDLLDQIRVAVEIEADGALVRFPARVAFHPHRHPALIMMRTSGHDAPEF